MLNIVYYVGGLTTISPTIVSNINIEIQKKLEFHPSGKICLKSKGLSEIIVGEIVVKSPYKKLYIHMYMYVCVCIYIYIYIYSIEQTDVALFFGIE